MRCLPQILEHHTVDEPRKTQTVVKKKPLCQYCRGKRYAAKLVIVANSRKRWMCEPCMALRGIK